MNWRIRKTVLATLKIDPAPFGLAGKDEGESYLIPGDHPQYEALHASVHKNSKVGAPKHERVQPWHVAMWVELHNFGLTTKLRTVEGITAWVREWLSRIPPGTCQCQKHGEEKLDACPVLPSDVIDNRTIFAWTVRYHNLINVLLNKPRVSVDAALAKWSSASIE